MVRKEERGSRDPAIARLRGSEAVPSNRRGSLVLGTLANPRADGIAVADRKFLLAVRHAHLGGGAPIEQPQQVAALRIPGDDHGTELGALHQPLIRCEVESTFFVARAAGLMTAHTSAFENRQYVLGEALRLSRAQLSRRRRHIENDHAGAKHYRRRR